MLELRNVSFQAENEDNGKEIEILRNINLTIEDQFVAVTGPNGSGKSTLAKIVAGILAPTEGQIFLDGVDITEKSITERAKLGIGFAFQQPVRFKGITVKDLLSIAAGKDTDMSEICSMLSEVGLCARDYVNREINASLSGGELKRIEIAMIMARKSRLAIFDEPEAGIDLWSFAKLTETFRYIHDKREATIVIISHQERIIGLADEIVLVADGLVSEQGPRAEIFPKILANTLPGCAFVGEEGQA